MELGYDHEKTAEYYAENMPDWEIHAIRNAKDSGLSSVRRLLDEVRQEGLQTRVGKVVIYRTGQHLIGEIQVVLKRSPLSPRKPAKVA